MWKAQISRSHPPALAPVPDEFRGELSCFSLSCWRLPLTGVKCCLPEALQALADEPIEMSSNRRNFA
jgi:hypothetical protein